MGPTPPDLPPEPKGKLPAWAIVLMIVAGLIIIAGGVCVVMLANL